MKKTNGLLLIVIVFLLTVSCITLKYIYTERDSALVKGIDIDCSLNIAEVKLQEGGFDSILALWALRDQIITADQAVRINDMYLKFMPTINNEFGIWHLAWAVSNFYRLGDDAVKEKLKPAYEDAVKQPAKLKQLNKIAEIYVNGDKIYSGFAHDLGKAFAQQHLVVPGDKNFIQSVDQFVKNSKNNKKLMKEINASEWINKCRKNSGIQ